MDLPGICYRTPDASDLGSHLGPDSTSTRSRPPSLSRPRSLPVAASGMQVMFCWLLCTLTLCQEELHGVTSDTWGDVTLALEPHNCSIWTRYGLLPPKYHRVFDYSTHTCGLGLLSPSDSVIPLISQQSWPVSISVPISQAGHEAPAEHDH